MNDKHVCVGGLPHKGYGEAVDGCYEEDNGTLWVENGEYMSQVNFCPYCGYKAKVEAVGIGSQSVESKR
jgi:hypothetical protein